MPIRLSKNVFCAHLRSRSPAICGQLTARHPRLHTPKCSVPPHVYCMFCLSCTLVPQAAVFRYWSIAFEVGLFVVRVLTAPWLIGVPNSGHVGASENSNTRMQFTIALFMRTTVMGHGRPDAYPFRYGPSAEIVGCAHCGCLGGCHGSPQEAY